MCPCTPPPTRIIDTSPPTPAPRKGRAPARRRLALLSVGLLGTTAVAGLAGATDGPAGSSGSEIVAVAGASQEPLEGGPDDVSVSPVSVAERAMADLAAATTTTEAPASTSSSSSSSTSSSSSSSSTSEAPATTAAPTTTAAPATTTSAAPTTAPPTTQAPPPPPPPAPEPQPAAAYGDPGGTQVWHDLAACESGGNWAANTGNGYYGGLQFSLGSWQAVGGSGHPHEHSAATQIEMGRRLQASQGWGAWPHCSQKLGLR